MVPLERFEVWIERATCAGAAENSRSALGLLTQYSCISLRAPTYGNYGVFRLMGNADLYHPP